MINAIYFFKRKPGLSLEQFEHHWREVHVPFIRALPGVRRYTQSQTLPSGYRKGEPVYDGVAELWFDDVDAMRRLADSPESKAAQEDGAHFLDPGTSDFLLTTERVVKDGTTTESMVKMIEFIRRKPGMTVEEFQRHWGNIHGPLGSALVEVRRYVQSNVLPAAYEAGNQPHYDGVAKLWFDSVDAMRRSEKDPAYPMVRTDEPNFIESQQFPMLICTERVIF